MKKIKKFAFFWTISLVVAAWTTRGYSQPQNGDSVLEAKMTEEAQKLLIGRLSDPKTKYWSGPHNYDIPENAVLLKFEKLSDSKIEYPKFAKKSYAKVTTTATFVGPKDKKTGIEFSYYFTILPGEGFELMDRKASDDAAIFSSEDLENPWYPYDQLLTKDPIKRYRTNKRIVDAVTKRSAFIGMPEDALEAAFGSMHVNENNYGGKITRQYMPEDGKYIYVEHGRVKSMQSHH
jgi:hypothetical protein